VGCLLCATDSKTNIEVKTKVGLSFARREIRLDQRTHVDGGADFVKSVRDKKRRILTMEAGKNWTDLGMA